MNASGSKEGQKPTVDYSELEDALMFVDAGAIVQVDGYICRKTGTIYFDTHGEYDDEFEVPDDVGDKSLYASVPHPHDLDLGKRLVFRFTKSHLTQHYDGVSDIFRRRGAYGRFKELLHEVGKLDDWYAFENAAREAALREWADFEGFEVMPPVIAAPEKILQFKITLAGTTPDIWRRIQILQSGSFWDLHVAIQDAMGWQDYHLHAFRVLVGSSRGMTIGIPDQGLPPGEQDFLPGWQTPLTEHFSEIGMSIEYEYDFGDGWMHDVQLEGILLGDPSTGYPRCTDGARACPPENCGGVPGYQHLLSVMSDPDHDEYNDLRSWLRPDFDPEEFSPGDIVFDDPDRRLDVALGQAL